MITQSLPHLKHFKFAGSSFIDRIPAQNIFEQFQSDFWQVQHQWFVEMIFDQTVGNDLHETVHVEEVHWIFECKKNRSEE